MLAIMLAGIVLCALGICYGKEMALIIGLVMVVLIICGYTLREYLLENEERSENICTCCELEVYD